MKGEVLFSRWETFRLASWVRARNQTHKAMLFGAWGLQGAVPWRSWRRGLLADGGNSLLLHVQFALCCGGRSCRAPGHPGTRADAGGRSPGSWGVWRSSPGCEAPTGGPHTGNPCMAPQGPFPAPQRAGEKGHPPVTPGVTGLGPRQWAPTEARGGWQTGPPGTCRRAGSSWALWGTGPVTGLRSPRQGFPSRSRFLPAIS